MFIFIADLIFGKGRTFCWTSLGYKEFLLLVHGKRGLKGLKGFTGWGIVANLGSEYLCFCILLSLWLGCRESGRGLAWKMDFSGLA